MISKKIKRWGSCETSPFLTYLYNKKKLCQKL